MSYRCGRCDSLVFLLICLEAWDLKKKPHVLINAGTTGNYWFLVEVHTTANYNGLTTTTINQT